MGTTAEAKPKRAKTKQIKDAASKSKIVEQVLALLGNPDNLYRIDVHLYRPGHARVNVWQNETIRTKKNGGFIGAMGSSEFIDTIHITDSHYLRLSKTAIIESASPTIERRY